MLSVMLDGFLRSPTEAGYVFYGLILATMVVKIRPWARLGAILGATVVFGILVHTIVKAISPSAVAGGPQSSGWISDLVHNWVVVPSNPTRAGNIGYVLLLVLVIALVQVKGRWRDILMVPTLYLAACVWEGVLVAQPSITRQILLGVILIVMMNARPNGSARTQTRRGRVTVALLELDKLSLSFGGLKALSELDISVDQGEVVSIIGPNGAGKSTVFNVVTGVYEPSSGDVRFDGKSIAGLQPYKITRRGIARTFQSLRLFLNMSVKENVMAATYGGTKATPLGVDLPPAARPPRGTRGSKAHRGRPGVLRPAAGRLPLGPARLQPLLRKPPAPRDRPRAGHEAHACCCSTSPPPA